MSGKIENQGISNLVFLYAGIGIGLINTVLRTRVLTPEQIGLIGILISISSVAAFLISFGLPSGILKFYGRFRSSPGQKTFFILLCLSIVLVLNLVVSVVFNRLEPLVQAKYNNELLQQFIKYVYFMFLFNGLNSVLSTVLRSEHRTVFVNFTLSFIDRAFFLVFLSAMLILPSLTFLEYFWFFLGTYGLKTAMLSIFLIRKVPLSRPSLSGFNRGLAGELVTYNAFMFLSGLAGVITATVDKLMIGSLMNLDAVGIYAIVMTFPLLIRMVGTGFGMIAQPIIADCFHSGDNVEVRRIYSSNTDIQILLGGAFLAAFAAFGEPGLAFLGEEYSKGFWVMIFLSVGEYLNLGTGMCGTIISFSKSFRFDLYLRLLLLVLAVTTNYLLIPILGINGAAIATASSLALYNIGKVVFVWFKFKMQPYDLTTLAVLAYAIVSGVALWWLQHLLRLSNLGLLLAVSVAYIAAYLIFGAMVLKLTPAMELVTTVKHILDRRTRRR